MCVQCYCYSVSVTSVSQREGTGKGVTYQYQCTWRVWHNACAGCCHSLIEGGELKRREGQGGTSQCIWTVWHSVCAECYCYSVSQREGTGEGVTYQYQCIWRVWHDVCAGCCHSRRASQGWWPGRLPLPRWWCCGWDTSARQHNEDKANVYHFMAGGSSLWWFHKNPNVIIIHL